jgi:hypothetical protein
VITYKPTNLSYNKNFKKEYEIDINVLKLTIKSLKLIPDFIKQLPSFSSIKTNFQFSWQEKIYFSTSVQKVEIKFSQFLKGIKITTFIDADAVELFFANDMGNNFTYFIKLRKTEFVKYIESLCGFWLPIENCTKEEKDMLYVKSAVEDSDEHIKLEEQKPPHEMKTQDIIYYPKKKGGKNRFS